MTLVVCRLGMQLVEVSGLKPAEEKEATGADRAAPAVSVFIAPA
jgi:hypothetical protein